MQIEEATTKPPASLSFPAISQRLLSSVANSVSFLSLDTTVTRGKSHAAWERGEDSREGQNNGGLTANELQLGNREMHATPSS